MLMQLLCCVAALVWLSVTASSVSDTALMLPDETGRIKTRSRTLERCDAKLMLKL